MTLGAATLKKSTMPPKRKLYRTYDFINKEPRLDENVNYRNEIDKRQISKSKLTAKCDNHGAQQHSDYILQQQKQQQPYPNEENISKKYQYAPPRQESRGNLWIRVGQTKLKPQKSAREQQPVSIKTEPQEVICTDDDSAGDDGHSDIKTSLEFHIGLEGVPCFLLVSLESVPKTLMEKIKKLDNLMRTEKNKRYRIELIKLE